MTSKHAMMIHLVCVDILYIALIYFFHILALFLVSFFLFTTQY